MLSYLIGCQLIGDFLLQNDWMQQKSKSSFVCTIHVLTYMIPFWVIMELIHLPWWAFGVIAAQHWLQDRFALHLKWMKFYAQTKPHVWPTGPLCVDQAMHVACLFIVSLCIISN